jgi:general secretion pathway protein D
VLGGCAEIRPYVPPSEGHIAAPQVKPEPERAIPPPARTTAFVPPPKPSVPPQTYSVVVNEVPVKELLLALSRDTKQNIDIHPTLSGLVSLNAINETLPAILDRVARQVNLRYRMEGNTLVVSPDTAYIKTYVVNYVNIQRTTTSSMGASGQITASDTGSGGGAGAGNTSSTDVKTTSSSDFWKTLEQSVRAILNSSLQQSLSAEAQQNRLQVLRQEQELRAKQMEAASRAGQAAPALATSVNTGGVPAGQPSTLLPDDVIVNAVAGTITVNGNEKQHQLVQEYLTKVETGAQRQVLIEATVVEVTLSDAYQGGIDWSRIALLSGFTFTQALLGGFPGATAAAGAAAGNALTVGYARADANRTINVTLKLLQEFGNTRVLSSPKMVTLNNQTALLKSVDNLVYFEMRVQAGTVSQGVVTQPTFNTSAKTVAVGVVMGVTPQIADDGRVLLTVRPAITRLHPSVPFINDPNPLFRNPCFGQPVPCLDLAVTNPVPQIQTREMESVLQVGSGQTVILGGLMQDDVQRIREQIPGADKLEAAGELFRFRNERARKSELVIFLRPTVIANPSLESDELRFFQRFLPQPDSPPQTPAEKAGSTR